MAEPESKQSSNDIKPRWSCISDKGMAREQNEDACTADERLGLFIVSDGMGGHAGGAQASQIVIESLPVILGDRLEKIKSKSSSSIRREIKRSIVELNKKVLAEGANGNGHRNMGATLVMAMINDGRWYIANVGDSRAYLLRRGKLQQLTKDHTFVNELVQAGYIEPTQASEHPDRNVITQCVGFDENIKPMVRSMAIKKGDKILLCSDGLTTVTTDEEISDIIKTHREPQDACKTLIARANQAGGPDNITVMIVNINS
ncbi:MAG: Stp1/IreP family PP2C-type Ser/Thr phosphatase [Phycisphaerae bacterium]|jgi:protein phosphatase